MALAARCPTAVLGPAAALECGTWLQLSTFGAGLGGRHGRLWQRRGSY